MNFIDSDYNSINCSTDKKEKPDLHRVDLMFPFDLNNIYFIHYVLNFKYH